MPTSRRRALVRYAAGMVCTLAGAGISESTGSMWPLAAGAAVLVMATAGWVAAVRRGAAAPRLPR